MSLEINNTKDQNIDRSKKLVSFYPKYARVYIYILWNTFINWLKKPLKLTLK